MVLWKFQDWRAHLEHEDAAHKEACLWMAVGSSCADSGPRGSSGGPKVPGGPWIAPASAVEECVLACRTADQNCFSCFTLSLLPQTCTLPSTILLNLLTLGTRARAGC
jgi:hypothetical protein